MNYAIRWACYRLCQLQRKLGSLWAYVYTRLRTPALMRAYRSVAETGGKGATQQPYKGYDLLRILRCHRPRRILELGSGTTTAVFAYYAKHHGATLISYEHSSEWAKSTNRSLVASGLVADPSPVRVVNMRVAEDRSGTYYADPIPEDADFVYVDGPPCLKFDGNKKPNLDVIRLFDRGIYPACIVVDGRTETVDRILEHPVAAKYRAEFEFIYAFRHCHYMTCLKFNRHTILTLQRE